MVKEKISQSNQMKLACWCKIYRNIMVWDIKHSVKWLNAGVFPVFNWHYCYLLHLLHSLTILAKILKFKCLKNLNIFTFSFMILTGLLILNFINTYKDILILNSINTYKDNIYNSINTYKYIKIYLKIIYIHIYVYTHTNELG